jgi:hypothetical protein
MLENNVKTNGNKEPTNGEYVNWRGKSVKIPSHSYNAGGRLIRYTAGKVLDTLEYYYKRLVLKDLSEISTEEQEENHHKSLLDTVITIAVNEKVCTLEDLHTLQMNRKIPDRKVQR